MGNFRCCSERRPEPCAEGAHRGSEAVPQRFHDLPEGPVAVVRSSPIGLHRQAKSASDLLFHK
jgi:hypothetical protein